MNICNRFCRNESGSIMMLTGFLLIPLIAFVGLVVDTTRAYTVRADLARAVDAAALAGGRTFYYDSADREAIIKAYFATNFDTGRFGTTANLSDLHITADEDAGTLSVTMDTLMPTTLMGVLGFHDLTIGINSAIERKDSTLELALVLDVTASMSKTCSGCVGGTKISALKDAINGTDGLLDILFGTNPSDPDLFIGVVPFSNVVNIGTGNASFLEPTSLSGLDWNGTLGGSGSWAGCVFERPIPNDISDAAPTTSFSQFYPFFAGSSTRHPYAGTVNNTVFLTFPPGSGFNRWSGSMTDGIGEFFDYNYANLPLRNANGGMWDERALYSGSWTHLTHTGAVGGFIDGCRLDAIQPLTNTRSTIQSMVNSLLLAGNTITTVGSAWGRRLLSPNWEGYWSGVPSGRPAAYGADDNFKAFVLMTDGENNFELWNGYGSNEDCSELVGGTPPVACWGDGVTGGDKGAAVDVINARQSQICEDMKDDGVRIYTIAFGLSAGSSTQKTVLENCAIGSGGQFFDAPTGSQMRTAFQAIASDLASLRLTQ